MTPGLNVSVCWIIECYNFSANKFCFCYEKYVVILFQSQTPSGGPQSSGIMSDSQSVDHRSQPHMRWDLSGTFSFYCGASTGWFQDAVIVQD